MGRQMGQQVPTPTPFVITVQDVASAAAKLGWSGIQLPPLGVVNSGSSGGALVSVGAAAARVAEEAPAAAMRQTLVDAISRGAQPADQLSACLAVRANSIAA